ncbi:MAG TPA: outer membrane beta-barrel protein [Candidatus Coprenecus pullicola]|nr:outer membrane beta-barrel protein [Candidatus Coprenecus pullicola]
MEEKQMKDEIFDRKIKELADSYSEVPSPDLWERIESGLDRRRRVVRWRRIVSYASAAAVVAGIFVTALLYQPDPTPEDTVVAVAGEQEAGGGDVRQEPGLKQVAMVFGRVSAMSQPVMSVRHRHTSVAPDTAVVQSNERIETVDVKVPEDIKDIRPGLPSIYDRSVQAEYIAMAGDASANTSMAGRKAPSFSIAASGHLSPTSASGNVDFSQPSYVQGGSAVSYYNGILPISEPRHYFPVSVGLELKYSFLNDRLGVGVGVNYTFLNSQYDALVSDMDNPFYYKYEGSVEQSIHYIGVPLNFYVNILSGKRLTFYANAGCMMEKAVSVEYDITDLVGTKYHKPFKPSGVQWSANIGLGLEYRFLSFMGIYVDPRLTYFFNCNQPYSVRTEQPLQFNLELGFRFHI